MTLTTILTVAPWAAFVVWVFYAFACDVARWWDDARWARDERRGMELIRMSESVSGAVVTDSDLEVAGLDELVEHGPYAVEPRRLA